MTCHADCIRLLVGWQRHERLSLGMILEHSSAAPYSIQQTQGVAAVMLPETGGKSNIWCWYCPQDCYFYASDTTLGRSPIAQQEECRSIFCHNNCKYVANIRKACQGAVGFCQKIMTPQWNNCASFYVFVTVIQIMSVTEGTGLLEQFSLSLHCHICCFL